MLARCGCQVMTWVELARPFGLATVFRRPGEAAAGGNAMTAMLEALPDDVTQNVAESRLQGTAGSAASVVDGPADHARGCGGVSNAHG